MFPVKYEWGFISQKTALFIVTAVETSDLTQCSMSSSEATAFWLVDDFRMSAHPLCRYPERTNGHLLSSSLKQSSDSYSRQRGLR
jgi:hypothetical protein